MLRKRVLQRKKERERERKLGTENMENIKGAKHTKETERYK